MTAPPVPRRDAPGLRRLKLFQTTAFRWTLGSAAVLGLAIAAMGGFFYWQTVGYLTARLDAGLLLEVRSLEAETRRVLLLRLDKALAVDARGNKAYGLFGPDGVRLAGDVVALPRNLPPPDRPAPVTVDWTRGGTPEPVDVRAVAVPLADGAVLFLGRSAGDLREIDEIVSRAIGLAALPAALLALVGGAFVSLATLRRVEAVWRACSLIMEGEFHRRLPVGRRRDEFDRLSEMVNRMLDEIERLVEEVRGAGDAIAHDLRTPLTRLRARLDRALDPEARHAPVAEVLGKSVADVDQILATVTAVLRLAEVEQGRRRGGFRAVDLGEVVEAVAELYAPVAEEKEIRFVLGGTAWGDPRRPASLPCDAEGGSVGLSAHPPSARGGTGPVLHGDGDLVFEAIANLVDNAVKYTLRGGQVGLSLDADGATPLVRVWDTGPGIPAGESEAVMRRFYRIDRSRHLPGTGLGLSLVAAIARLHGFTLAIGERQGGGCEVLLRCGAGQQADATGLPGSIHLGGI